MSQYTVKSDILHDGKRYAIGSRIELPESSAARLLAGGWIAAEEKDSAADAKTPKPEQKGKK
ncbi:MAG: hypothetical protein LBS70_08080 [Candidatus Accumulibacter sp.]|jgi:hypothetical protein|nr:hypothetical protein [Accumulibacter sp.]